MRFKGRTPKHYCDARRCRLILTLLFLLLGLASTGVTTGGGGTTSGGCGRSDVREELRDVLSLEGLGEEAGPVALDIVAGGLDDLGEFLIL